MPEQDKSDLLRKFSDQVDELRAQNEALRERIDTHEEWLQKMMPTRRDVLVGGAAGLAGAGAIMGTTGTAAAADTSSGNVGTTGDSVDVFLDEIRDDGGDVVADIDDTGAIDWQSRGFTNLGTVGLQQSDYTGLSDDTTNLLYEGIISGNLGVNFLYQNTNGVGTTAKTILDPNAGDVAPRLLSVSVGGLQSGATSTRFLDLVQGLVGFDTTVSTSVTNSTPAGRTYSWSGGSLQLAMGSDTYDVAAYGFAARIED